MDRGEDSVDDRDGLASDRPAAAVKGTAKARGSARDPRVEQAATSEQQTPGDTAAVADGSKSRDAAGREQLLWRIAIGLAIVGLCGLAASGLIMRWDRSISTALRAGDLPGDVRKAIQLSEAFAHGSGVVTILLCILLASARARRPAIWSIVLMTAICGISANLLKAAFARARPYTYDAETPVVADVTGWEFLGTESFWDASQRSFPSGHTATAWALAFGLSLLFPRATAVFLFLAIMATYQRLFSGAHFPSDTMAGFGIACLGCAAVLAIPGIRRNLCTAEA